MFSLKECEETRLNGKTLKEWAITEPDRLESMYENCFDENTAIKIMVVYKHHVLSKSLEEKRNKTKEKYNEKM